MLSQSTSAAVVAQRSVQLRSAMATIATPVLSTRLNAMNGRGLGRAWALAIKQDLTAAAALADRLRFQGNDETALRRNRLDLDLLWSFIYLMKDDGTRALAHAESARRRSEDAHTTQVTAALRRCCFWLLGDLQTYNSMPKPLFNRSNERREQIIQPFLRAVETAVQAQQLRLGTAERLSGTCATGAQAPRLLKEPFLLPAVVAATLLYERGELREAAVRVRRLLPAIRAHGCIESALHSYKTLARAAFRLRQAELALSVLREGESVAENKSWTRLALACIAERVQVLADLNRLSEAELHLARLRALSDTRSADQAQCHIGRNLYCHWAGSRLELLRDPTATTAERLRGLIQDAVGRGELKQGVELAVRLVALLFELGETREAAEVLESILLVSADAGLFQTVIDGGPEVRTLLRECTPGATRPSHVDAYAQMLLEAWSEPAAPVDSNSRGRRKGVKLTARECSVLELIGAGNSNKHVARHLGITPETVKSHTKRIFQRLGASTRAEAVSKAAYLGLL
jgi:LuxR family transcriptional regulator, maltose regulon positive regulatory protein